MIGSGLSLAEQARRGVQLCRDERWEEGLEMLAQVFNSASKPSGELPMVYLSYLGYGIARYHNKREGLALCEQAVKLEFYQPESLYNLARTAAYLGERRKAIKAVERALKLDPRHAESLALHAELGRRRDPVLSFLSREHAINRFLGQLRHGLKKSPTGSGD